MNHFLAVGCSHTAGVGVEPGKVYVDHISSATGLKGLNLAQDGASSEHCLQQIVEVLQDTAPPKFIIAQWPNIYRKKFYADNGHWFENVNSHGEAFAHTLKLGDANFVQPWCQHIITANTLAKARGIPIYHICLEYYEQQPVSELEKLGVVLHMDLQKPGKTWLFDNAGSDGVHHSAVCHSQWAERILGIINESTK